MSSGKPQAAAGSSNKKPGAPSAGEKKIIDSTVNMIKTGPGANFHTVWPKLTTLAMAEFGRVAQCLEEGEAYVYPDPDPSDYLVIEPVYAKAGDPDPEGPEPEDDEEAATLTEATAKIWNNKLKQRHELEKTLESSKLVEATKSVMKARAKMEEQAPKLFAFILGHLSTDSQETIKIQDEWDGVNLNKDPVGLVKLIQRTHRTNNAAYMDDVQTKYVARKNFENLRKRDWEGVSAYYQRFKDTLSLAIDAGNPSPSIEDLVQNFIGGLDNNVFREYKSTLANNVAQGIRVYPPDLVQAYREVVTYSMTLPASKLRGSGAGRGGGSASAFATKSTKAGGARGGDKGTNKNNKTTKPQPDKVRPKPRGKCFRCGEYGHFIADCPHEDDEGQGDETADGHFTTATAFVCREENTTQPHEVLLDNQSEVSVVHPSLCSKVRPKRGKCTVNMAGKTVPIYNEGFMRHFGWVWVSEHLPANLLCFADIEDKYKIDRVPRDSFTVHLPEGEDLVFARRNKFYVADCSAWCQPQPDKDFTAHTVTVAQLEATLTKAERKRLDAARKFVARAGFPSEPEAVRMLQDGNINATFDFHAADIRNVFRIPNNPHDLRGKRTNRKTLRLPVDMTLVDIRAVQEMQTDIVHFGAHQFLFTHVDPLKLVLLRLLTGTDAGSLGRALEEHISTVKAHKYSITRVFIEPTPTALAMVGSAGDVVVQPTGAGEHLDKLDRSVRSVKEIARAVKSSLVFKKIPKVIEPDLPIYAGTRFNSRSSTGKVSSIAPKVEMTGRKIHKRDFEAGFMDYCEVFVGSDNTMSERTHPGLMLYPLHNASGAWRIFDLRTRRKLVRSNFKILPITQAILDLVNGMDGEDIEQLAPPEEELPAEGATPIGTHQLVAINDIDRDVIVVDEEDELPRQAQAGAPQLQEDELAAAPAEEACTRDPLSPDLDPLTPDPPPDGDPPPAAAPTTEPEPGPRRVLPARENRGVPPSKYSYRVSNRRYGASHGHGRGRAYHTVDTGHISLRAGMKRFGKRAIDAMNKELASIIDEKRAATPVRLSELSNRQRKKVVRSMLFFKEKFTHGVFERLKARLVANGAQQDRGLYPNHSSPTASLECIFMVLAIAAKERREVAVVDIGTAYLNAEMGDEEVFIETDPFLTRWLLRYKPSLEPFTDKGGKMFFRLTKALYGCVQSARLWYEKITAYLKSIGFRENELDNCILNAVYKGKQMTVALYVDDLLITCRERAGVERLVDQLRSEYGEVKYKTGEKLSYLGMCLETSAKGITVSMTDYIKNILEEYAPARASGGKRYSCPAGESFFDVCESAALGPERAKVFHSTVAKLLYVSLRVLPHVGTAVGFLTTRVTAPTEEDERKLKRVLAYLQTIGDRGVLLPVKGEIRIRAWVDAAFAVHQSNGASHTGVVIALDNAMTLARSSKQRMLARNSTEAELIGLTDKMDHVMRCHDFIVSQGHEPPPPVVYQDNMSTIHLVTVGGGKGGRTRHLRARQYAMKELVDSGEIQVEYCPTEEMLADMLTKPLGGDRYVRLCKSITHDGPPLC